MVYRRTTYRLYPNKRQEGQLYHLLQLHCQLYNAALAQRISFWNHRKRLLTFYEQRKELSILRTEDAEYRVFNAQSQRITLKKVDMAFRNFFGRLRKKHAKPGFPRFKKQSRFSSFGYETYGNGWKLDTNKKKLYLSNIGLLGCRGRARIEGQPKTLDVFVKNGLWFASVVSEVSSIVRNGGAAKIGIDWGVKTFASVISEGGATIQIANPKHLKTSLIRLKRASRKLSRKKRGSIRYYRQLLKVRKLYGKKASQLKDFLHKISAQIVGSASLIAVEKLNIINMIRVGGHSKKSLNRSILDTAPGTFHQMLKYKAEEAGIEWYEIPTQLVKPTQTCSNCGRQKKKTLSQREHICECGFRVDRDINAAKVILNWALKNRSNGQELAMCEAGQGICNEARSQ